MQPKRWIAALAACALLCAMAAPTCAAKPTKTPKPTPTATPTPTEVPRVTPLPEAAERQPGEMPPQIRRMIEVAQEQLERHGTRPIKPNNDYSRWYFHDERKIGWCACFVAWCADQAGVPLMKEAMSEAYLAEGAQPLGDDIVFASNEAHVVRTQNTYRNLNRFTDIPRPGYQVIYGVIGGTSSTHVGLVETVTELSPGVYELTTIEGNVSDTVKRYCTRYTVKPKQKYQNYRAVPKAEQSRDGVQYKLQKAEWYITGFGVTWK